jgi:hypothetical protein
MVNICQWIVFANGQAIIYEAYDMAIAKLVCSRYIGNLKV